MLITLRTYKVKYDRHYHTSMPQTKPHSLPAYRRKLCLFQAPTDGQVCESEKA